MNIETYNFARFRNAELVSLVDDVLIVTNDFDWVGLKVEGFYTGVKTSLKKFEAQLNKMNTVPETRGVEEGDYLFNNSWRALKFIFKAHLLSPSAEKRKAAEILNNLCKIHGYNLHTESYQEQNAKAKMFLADCEGLVEAKEAIATIAAQKFINNVQDALNEINLCIGNRKSKENKELRDDDTKKSRELVHNALSDMFKYMESMSGLTAGGPFDAIIKSINGSIQKIEVIHKSRDSRNSD